MFIGEARRGGEGACLTKMERVNIYIICNIFPHPSQGTKHIHTHTHTHTHTISMYIWTGEYSCVRVAYVQLNTTNTN